MAMPGECHAMNETDQDEKLSDTGEQQSTVARTLSWTWQILGILLGTATTISIIKSGFAIDVYGLPAKVLSHYVWLRDTLFVPAVWVVHYFGIEIAWWIKDLIMAYALVGAAHARAYQVMNAIEIVDGEQVGGTSFTQSLSALLLWPQISRRLFRELVRALEDRKYFKDFAKRTGSRHPELYFPLQQADWTVAEAIDHLRHIGLQLAAISVATTAFFLWNYLSGVFGPA
jgi:hypothetical protein